MEPSEHKDQTEPPPDSDVAQWVYGTIQITGAGVVVTRRHTRHFGRGNREVREALPLDAISSAEMHGSILTLSLQVTYKNAKDFERDATWMSTVGWVVQGQSQAGDTVKVGGTLMQGALTGGAGLLLMGRSKKSGEIVVTWVKAQPSVEVPSASIAAPPEPATSPRESVSAQLRELAQLHNEGVLTDEEFDAKKAELLTRM